MKAGLVVPRLKSVEELKKSDSVITFSAKLITQKFSLLDIGENRRLKPAFLAAFFAFDDKVSESVEANNSDQDSRTGRLLSMLSQRQL